MKMLNESESRRKLQNLPSRILFGYKKHNKEQECLQLLRHEHILKLPFPKVHHGTFSKSALLAFLNKNELVQLSGSCIFLEIYEYLPQSWSSFMDFKQNTPISSQQNRHPLISAICNDSNYTIDFPAQSAPLFSLQLCKSRGTEAISRVSNPITLSEFNVISLTARIC